MGETVFRVGPKNVKPATPGAVVLDPPCQCGGTEWVQDRTYDWKRDDKRLPKIIGALTWKCVGCGWHRMAA